VIALAGCGRIDFDPVPVVPLAPPIAAYSLDENAGQTIESSISPLDGFLGDGPNPSADDPTWVPGRFGSALAFDAVDDRVFIAYPPTGYLASSALHDAVSISAWIRPSSQATTYRVVFEIGGESNCATLGLTNTGHVTFILRDLRMMMRLALSLESTLTPAVGSWYYVAGTADAAAMDLYIYDDDGTQLEHVTGPGGFVWDTGTDGIGLGANPAGNSGMRGMLSTGFESFDGVVDEVRVFDFAISEDRVLVDLRTPLP
jgi:Concanavalin A-like lectin/glucanases superfamily